MSYTPTNWKAGDVVTSAKLNKMEQGIAASGRIRIVHMTGNEGSPSLQLDITPNELMDAFQNGEVVIIITDGFGGINQFLLSRVSHDDTTFTITINENTPQFTSSDPDEYFTFNPNSESSGDEIAGGEHAR